MQNRGTCHGRGDWSTTMYVKRALRFRKRALRSRKRALRSRRRALYPRKQAIYSCKRVLRSHKRALNSRKEAPYFCERVLRSCKRAAFSRKRAIHKKGDASRSWRLGSPCVLQRVLQCVAVCCSVLQNRGTRHSRGDWAARMCQNIYV